LPGRHVPCHATGCPVSGEISSKLGFISSELGFFTSAAWAKGAVQNKKTMVNLIEIPP
jgi:hypothetical protein